MTGPQFVRVLAIAPSSRGFGYALMEGMHRLIDWGVKSVKGDKNDRALAQVADLISHYKPTHVALEDFNAPGIRRASRIQALVADIIALSEGAGINVKLHSRKQIMKVFSEEGGKTKQSIAEELARRYPNELGFRVPRRRKPWMSQDYRMDIFDAVALAEFSIASVIGRRMSRG